MVDTGKVSVTRGVNWCGSLDLQEKKADPKNFSNASMDRLKC